MNTGTIVGYITRRDGSPVGNAEIWISRAGESGAEAEAKSAAKTDSRGYFQLAFADSKIEIVAIGAEKGIQTNPKSKIASENRFRVTGYLVKENSTPNA